MCSPGDGVSLLLAMRTWLQPVAGGGIFCRSTYGPSVGAGAGVGPGSGAGAGAGAGTRGGTRGGGLRGLAVSSRSHTLPWPTAGSPKVLLLQGTEPVTARLFQREPVPYRTSRRTPSPRLQTPCSSAQWTQVLRPVAVASACMRPDSDRSSPAAWPALSLLSLPPHAVTAMAAAMAHAVVAQNNDLAGLRLFILSTSVNSDCANPLVASELRNRNGRNGGAWDNTTLLPQQTKRPSASVSVLYQVRRSWVRMRWNVAGACRPKTISHASGESCCAVQKAPRLAKLEVVERLVRHGTHVFTRVSGPDGDVAPAVRPVPASALAPHRTGQPVL